MKPLLSRILICLVPVVLACGVVGWAFAQYARGEGGFRLGIDLVGGTILVYEVDESKQKNIDSGQGGGPKLDLAAALKRRIDPADLYNITIRNVPATPGSPPRVEIVLPTGGRHQSDIGEKRWNDLLAKVRDKYPDQLARLASSGEPPPPPRVGDLPDGPLTFDITLNGQPYTYSYSWVEVGKEELYTLGLNNDAAKPNHPKHFHWQQAATARDAKPAKADFISLASSGTSTFLLYSRKIPNTDRLSPKDRDLGKQYEYFILVRAPQK